LSFWNPTLADEESGKVEEFIVVREAVYTGIVGN
jgi:hypothetical protein